MPARNPLEFHQAKSNHTFAWYVIDSLLTYVSRGIAVAQNEIRVYELTLGKESADARQIRC